VSRPSPSNEGDPVRHEGHATRYEDDVSRSEYDRCGPSMIVRVGKAIRSGVSMRIQSGVRGPSAVVGYDPVGPSTIPTGEATFKGHHARPTPRPCADVRGRPCPVVGPSLTNEQNQVGCPRPSVAAVEGHRVRLSGKAIRRGRQKQIQKCFVFPRIHVSSARSDPRLAMLPSARHTDKRKTRFAFSVFASKEHEDSRLGSRREVEEKGGPESHRQKGAKTGGGCTKGRIRCHLLNIWEGRSGSGRVTTKGAGTDRCPKRVAGGRAYRRARSRERGGRGPRQKGKMKRGGRVTLRKSPRRSRNREKKTKNVLTVEKKG